MPRLKLKAFLAFLALHSMAMAGGIAPDGGALMSHSESRVAQRQTKTIEGLPSEYYPRLSWADEFSVQVESIVVHGNSLVPNEKLQGSLKGFVGKRISVERLSTVTNAVVKAYKEAGFKVRAYIPDQNFARGKLIVQVIEVP